jgi:hypothetical protein
MRTEMKNKTYKKLWLKDKIKKKKNKTFIKGIRMKWEIQRMRTKIEWQQTKRIIVHFSYQEREKKEKKIDHSRQSNYYKLTCATTCGRGHDCITRETTNDQIWPPGGVTRATWMARTPTTRWCVWNTSQ